MTLILLTGCVTKNIAVAPIDPVTISPEDKLSPQTKKSIRTTNTEIENANGK